MEELYHLNRLQSLVNKVTDGKAQKIYYCSVNGVINVKFLLLNFNH